MSKSRTKERFSGRARAAAKAIAKSPIASKLKAEGITAQSMSKWGEDLDDLDAAQEAAKTQLQAATGRIVQAEDEFRRMWTKYSNLVRALVEEPTERANYGVASPGYVRGPRFHRQKSASPASTTGSSS